MKKIFTGFTLLVFALGLFSFVTAPTGQPVTYKLTAATSSINWSSTSEDGTAHNGSLKFKSGNLKFDVKTLLSGFTYINMQSLDCADISDEGFNRELITEMRSPEQLNLAKYKEATFKITKAKRLDVAEGQPNYDVTGLLKLKGLSLPVQFKATVVQSKKEVTLNGSFDIAKADAQLPYDMTFEIVMNTEIVK